VIYLDSSVLLAAYLDEALGERARTVLADRRPKVSSWLVSVEVPVVLHRAMAQRPAEPARFVRALADWDRDMVSLNLYAETFAITRLVRADDRFSRCRSLDAIHAATAFHLRSILGLRVEVATFDRRLAETAVHVGLPLHPLTADAPN